MENQQRFFRRNELAILWQGVLFMAGLAFIDPNTVIPVFVATMSGSLAMAGLVSASRVIPSTLAQFFVGIRAGSIKDVPRYLIVAMLAAYSIPMLIAVMLFLPTPETILLPLFFVLSAILWLGDGSTAIPWFDFLGRAVNERRRGLLLGRMQILGGLAALGCSAVVKLVLGTEGLSVRTRYAVLFVCAAVFMLISVLSMARAKDAPHRKALTENPFKHIGTYPKLFISNKGFLKCIAVQACQGIAAMSIPFIILFSVQTFHLSNAQVGWMIPIQISGGLLGGFVWGQISHKFGNRRVIQANQCVLLLVMAVGLFTALSHMLLPIYPLALLAGASSSCWMGYPNYIMDIIAVEKRPQYLVMSSLANLPFTFLPYMAGLLAASVGFAPVFAICLLAAASGVALSFQLQSPQTLSVESFPGSAL